MRPGETLTASSAEPPSGTLVYAVDGAPWVRLDGTDRKWRCAEDRTSLTWGELAGRFAPLVVEVWGGH